MRGLVLGLAATLLVTAARADGPGDQTVIEGTAEGKIRITNPDGMVLECLHLSLSAEKFGEHGETVTIEPAPEGRVTLRIVEAGFPDRGDRKEFTAGRMGLSPSSPLRVSFFGPGEVSIEGKPNSSHVEP